MTVGFSGELTGNERGFDVRASLRKCRRKLASDRGKEQEIALFAVMTFTAFRRREQTNR
jgi:hypothetical protein